MHLAPLLRRSLAQSVHVLVPVLLLLMVFQILIIAQAVTIESTHSFEQMAKMLPGFLQRGLGSSAMLLASFKGIVAFGYFHPVVAILVSVLAVYFGSEPASDVESGVVDLVLARSIPRHRLITRSLLLVFGVTVAAAGAMALGSWIGLRTMASPTSNWPSPAILATLLLHMVSVAWCFGGLAMALASGARRWSPAFGSAAITVVALYLVDIISLGWPATRLLARLSPFHYYPALPIVEGAAVGVSNLLVLWSAAAVLVGVAYWRFDRRDV